MLSKMPKRPGKHCNAGSSCSWCWRGRVRHSHRSLGVSPWGSDGVGGQGFSYIFSYQMYQIVFLEPGIFLFSIFMYFLKQILELKNPQNHRVVVVFLSLILDEQKISGVGKRNLEITSDTYQSWMFGESQNSFPRFWVNFWAIDLLYVYMIWFSSTHKKCWQLFQRDNLVVVSACFKHFFYFFP